MNQNERFLRDLAKTFIGSDSLFNNLTQAVSFPKYEIVRNKTNDNIQVRVLLAGYQKEDINLYIESGMLFIEHQKEEKSNESEDIDYLSDRVIAKRSFKLQFRIAENLKVGKVNFENGILFINFEKDETKPNRNNIDIE